MKYRDFVNKVNNSHLTLPEAQVQSLMGLSEEVGELLGLFKKFYFYDKPIEHDKLIGELGDVRHYFESLLISLEITMKEVEDANVAKLKKRYPDGFSKKAARERKDVG